MKWQIGYNKLNDTVTILADDSTNPIWESFTRVLAIYSQEYYQKGSTIAIPFRFFLGLRKNIAQFLANHVNEISVKYSGEIVNKLNEINPLSYHTAISATEWNATELNIKLNISGFKRSLTDNQINNLKKLAPLPAGATFSVPGAGKTTEALAYFFVNKRPEDKLLVVAPKNAFGAWEEQIIECTGSTQQQFVRLRGGRDAIDRILQDNPGLSIITYQQYARVTDIIKAFLIRNHVFMFLDESHRIKSGLQGVTPEAILSCSYLPIRKLIMSGTPMPQSVNDLIPQFMFLYPDYTVDTKNVVSAIQPIYVRTTAEKLGLPKMERKTIVLNMTPLQMEVYHSIKSAIKRELMPMLSDSSKFSLRELGKRIIKVMQYVSNPGLLASDLDYIFDSKMGETLAKNDGVKIEYACKRAIELASQNKKVIIWTQFVRNVEIISERLKFLGADFIHGRVDAGSEKEEDTREWKIKEFHSNPQKMVLVANPAAASEGISLHKICQNAIYVDRSFNAAHYLQSEDRIHRLGLKPDQHPEVEILECRGTIDQLIDQRLKKKVDLMSRSLNDSSLCIDTIHYDMDIDADEIINEDDIEEIKKYFEDDNQ